MKSTPTVPIRVPGSRQGSHREFGPRSLPRAQLSIDFDPIAENENDTREHREAFREAVNLMGGPDALRSALGRPSSYLSKLSEGMTGARPIQSAWEAPLLHHEHARWPLVRYYNRKAGLAEPVEARTISRAEIAEVSLQIDVENPMLWTAKRPEIARRLGVPVAQVKP